MNEHLEPIICPECFRHLGFSGRNALHYPAGDRYLVITPVNPTKKLVIACPCGEWFKTWDFKKPKDAKIAA